MNGFEAMMHFYAGMFALGCVWLAIVGAGLFSCSLLLGGAGAKNAQKVKGRKCS